MNSMPVPPSGPERRFSNALAWLSMLVLLIVAPVAPADDPPPPEPPEAVVASLEQQLIDNMRATDRDFDQRYALLRPMMDEIMAAARMARYIFGRDWREFEPEQRERFVELFMDLSAATYASQFDQYNNEEFAALEVQRQADDRALVRRQLTTGSGREVAFDYLMTLDHGQWRIVTIVTDGVSDLAMKRSQYRRIVDEQGFDGLIRHLQEAVAKQREG
ncbi:MAG: ABC transporter substrate-binding protein [Wenzhouxiangellaceae bacterium]